MKLPRLMTSLAVVAIVAACGGSDAKNTAAAAATDNTAVRTEEGTSSPVIQWTGGKISPDKNLTTVIDFNAVWCGPCQKFAPVFESVADQYAGEYRFISVDVDKCRETAEQFQVSSIPQITILRPDGSMNSAVGYMTETEFKTFLSM